MIEMYVRPFFIYMRKGLASFILGLASPRLALDSTYPSGNTEKQEGRIGVTAACSAWTKWALGITALSGHGYRTLLIYREPRRCNLRLY